MDDTRGLFFAYIIDGKICSFGDRWMAEEQIKDIKRWENKNYLDPLVSKSYHNCLQFLIQYDLIYESEWTSQGNPRKFSLYSSLQQLFSDCPEAVIEKLQEIKNDHCHYEELPF